MACCQLVVCFCFKFSNKTQIRRLLPLTLLLYNWWHDEQYIEESLREGRKSPYWIRQTRFQDDLSYSPKNMLTVPLGMSLYLILISKAKLMDGKTSPCPIFSQYALQELRWIAHFRVSITSLPIQWEVPLSLLWIWLQDIGRWKWLMTIRKRLRFG